jgi:plastocyanin
VIRNRWRLAAAGATIFMLGQLVIAAPVGASGGAATVTADMPSAVPAGHLWAFNDFFPRTVSVPTGSDLQFINEGFHTFTILPAGATAQQDSKTNGVGLNDPDDTILNANGTTHAVLNQVGLGPTSVSCGSSVAPCGFDGGAVVSSGIPGGPPAPFVVHVTAAPGRYVFHCRVHAGMSGQLDVLPAGEHGPSQAQVQKRVQKQIQRDLKGAWTADAKANRDAARLNAGGSKTLHIIAGTSSPDGHVALLEFFPKDLHASAGDKVDFVPRSPNEPHTVTFPGDLGNEFQPMCEDGSTDTPIGLTGCNFGPPDEVEFDGGNGVSNVTTPTTISDSGFIGPRRLTREIGLPSTAVLNTWTVSFAGAASGTTYTYVCQIHDGMDAQVTLD